MNAIETVQALVRALEHEAPLGWQYEALEAGRALLRDAGTAPNDAAISWAERYADAYNDCAPSRVDIVNAVYWGMRFKWRETVATPPAAVPGIPAGYALVPITPTEAMVEACLDFDSKTAYLDHPDVPYLGTENGDSEDAWVNRLFRAFYAVLLAAAPAAPEDMPND